MGLEERGWVQERLLSYRTPPRPCRSVESITWFRRVVRKRDLAARRLQAKEPSVWGEAGSELTNNALSSDVIL